MKIKMIQLIIYALVLFSCGKKSTGENNNTPPETKPTLSITNVQNTRDTKNAVNFIFVVNTSKAYSKPITVHYTTVDETAKATTDYTPVNGTLTIPANTWNASISVSVPANNLREAPKTFYLQLSDPVNATLSGNGKAIGTILSDGTDLNVDNSGYTTPLAQPGYVLKWSDEFNGNVLDNTAWNYETGGSGWGNNELQNYTTSAKNSFLTNGYLVIEARKETVGNNDYTSARLQTLGKKEFTYGRVDIRAKLPKGKGIWPALWMLGANIATTPWPASGEIDIMEVLGHEPNKTYGTIHWGNVGSGSTHIGKDYSLPSGDFSQSFHVFSFIWTADKMEWLIDDVKFYTAFKSEVNGNYPFDKPFFFILNVAVGGNWPGNPDASTVFPQRMIVDYIRMFQ